MMQPLVGIDIIEISRIRGAIFQWKDRFLNRVFTDSELELCKGRVESLAVRFAGKEAAMKALYEPGVNITWHEIEILSDTGGKPRIVLYGQAKEQARRLALTGLTVSLSHSRNNAIALVIGIRED
jgi:holo-[acyl-carrier protein] synthase